MTVKLKVGFICVHNSCRSQIAEALGHHYASDVFESYSAGTTNETSNKSRETTLWHRYGSKHTFKTF